MGYAVPTHTHPLTVADRRSAPRTPIRGTTLGRRALKAALHRVFGSMPRPPSISHNRSVIGGEPADASFRHVLPLPWHRSIVLNCWSLHQTRGASAYERVLLVPDRLKEVETHFSICSCLGLPAAVQTIASTLKTPAARMVHILHSAVS
jgi:hypothetical protein